MKGATKRKRHMNIHLMCFGIVESTVQAVNVSNGARSI